MLRSSSRNWASLTPAKRFLSLFFKKRLFLKKKEKEKRDKKPLLKRISPNWASFDPGKKEKKKRKKKKETKEKKPLLRRSSRSWASFDPGGPAGARSRAVKPREKFSKVNAQLYMLYKVTKEIANENICLRCCAP